MVNNSLESRIICYGAFVFAKSGNAPHLARDLSVKIAELFGVSINTSKLTYIFQNNASSGLYICALPVQKKTRTSAAHTYNLEPEFFACFVDALREKLGSPFEKETHKEYETASAINWLVAKYRHYGRFTLSSPKKIFDFAAKKLEHGAT